MWRPIQPRARITKEILAWVRLTREQPTGSVPSVRLLGTSLSLLGALAPLCLALHCRNKINGDNSHDLPGTLTFIRRKSRQIHPCTRLETLAEQCDADRPQQPAQRHRRPARTPPCIADQQHSQQAEKILRDLRAVSA
jgi:hypothetical protein